MPKEILIKGGHIVTVDPKLGDLTSGDVLVRGGLIVDVGTDLVASTADAEVFDARAAWSSLVWSTRTGMSGRERSAASPRK